MIVNKVIKTTGRKEGIKVIKKLATKAEMMRKTKRIIEVVIIILLRGF